MARRRKGEIGNEVLNFLITIIFLIIIAIYLTAFFTYIFLETYPFSCMFTILLFFSVTGRVLLKLWRRRKASQRRRVLTLENMAYFVPRHTFERYVAQLLRAQGYQVSVPKDPGDFGVDLIAEKYGVRYAVRCKPQTPNVSRRAVSDVVAGKYRYNCSEAMVVTNSHFTQDAIELARSTRCILVDRNTLADWIMELQRTAKPKRAEVYWDKPKRRPSRFHLTLSLRRVYSGLVFPFHSPTPFRSQVLEDQDIASRDWLALEDLLPGKHKQEGQSTESPPVRLKSKSDKY
mgnify:FL=1